MFQISQNDGNFPKNHYRQNIAINNNVVHYLELNWYIVKLKFSFCYFSKKDVKMDNFVQFTF